MYLSFLLSFPKVLVLWAFKLEWRAAKVLGGLAARLRGYAYDTYLPL